MMVEQISPSIAPSEVCSSVHNVNYFISYLKNFLDNQICFQVGHEHSREFSWYTDIKAFLQMAKIMRFLLCLKTCSTKERLYPYLKNKALPPEQHKKPRFPVSLLLPYFLCSPHTNSCATTNTNISIPFRMSPMPPVRTFFLNDPTNSL